MKLTIHRGTHEIGGSCVHLRSETSGTELIVDFGMPLVNSDQSEFEWRNHKDKNINQLVSERILPSIKGIYKTDTPTISAVLLSHAHQDHYGFMRFVSPKVPFYMSNGTKALAEVSNLFNDTSIDLTNVCLFNMWETFTINDFTITPYLMDHSAPDACAFLIEADGTKVFYTGDFRGHGRKKILFERLRKDPPKDIDYLLMEGSMMGRDELLYPDEESVENAILGKISGNTCPCFVITSSQNLDRIVSVYKAAIRAKRLFVIDLYTAYVLEQLKGLSDNIPQYDWADVRIYYLPHHAKKLETIDKELFYRYVKHKIGKEEIITGSGNQVIFAKDNRYYRNLMRNSTDAIVIYSMWHGYLEKGNLKEFSSDNEIELTEIHTSGHAIKEHLKDIVDAIGPKHLIPIHTFYPEDFKMFSANAICLVDGQTIEL